MDLASSIIVVQPEPYKQEPKDLSKGGQIKPA